MQIYVLLSPPTQAKKSVLSIRSVFLGVHPLRESYTTWKRGCSSKSNYVTYRTFLERHSYSLLRSILNPIRERESPTVALC